MEKTYKEWFPIFEKEGNCKVLDDDGGRLIESQLRQNDLLTKEEAYGYFVLNTVSVKITKLFGGNYDEKL